MEMVNLTIDKSKPVRDGTRTPASTDALTPQPEYRSIKQAKSNTLASMTRPNLPDAVWNPDPVKGSPGKYLTNIVILRLIGNLIYINLWKIIT